jgi:hypothetical protein
MGPGAGMDAIEKTKISLYSPPSELQSHRDERDLLDILFFKSWLRQGYHKADNKNLHDSF